MVRDKLVFKGVSLSVVCIGLLCGRGAHGADRLESWLGIEISSAERQCVVVTGLEPNGAAAQAGLQPDDCIQALDGLRTESPEQFFAALRTTKPGVSVVLTRDNGAMVKFVVDRWTVQREQAFCLHLSSVRTRVVATDLASGASTIVRLPARANLGTLRRVVKNFAVATVTQTNTCAPREIPTILSNASDETKLVDGSQVAFGNPVVGAPQKRLIIK